MGKFSKIKEAIDEMVNPGLSMHDGSVEIIDHDLGSEPPVLKLKFNGRCGSCPSSFSQTLNIVTELLREEAEIHDLVVVNVTEKPEKFNLKYVYSEDEDS